MRTRGRPLPLLAATLLLTACSVVSDPDPPDRATPEKETVRLGVGNVIETAPVRIAVQNGVFRRAGLDVQLVEQPGGKATVESLANGELDVAFARNVPLFRAAARGVPLRVQGEAYVAGADSMALVTLPDSGPTEPTDLAWPSIAVDGPESLGTLTTRSVLDTAGLAPETITFVPTPAPQRVEALRRREVDVAWMVEPYLTLAQKDHGARLLADSARGATEAFPMSAYATTREFADEHPRTVATFRRALAEAQRLATDETRVREALPDLTDVDEVTAALVSLGNYPQVANAVRLQRVADLMQGAGLLQERLDVRALVAEPELSGREHV